VIDERSPIEPVKDLCEVGAHAGAETRREYQNVEHFMLFLHICHIPKLQQRMPIAMISFLYRQTKPS
jgi:hypothetical protein